MNRGVEEMPPEAKPGKVVKRRITKKDFDEIANFVLQQLHEREENPYRRAAQDKWKVVDQQIALESPKRKTVRGPDGKPLPDLFLHVGDVVEMSSPQIGSLRNRIVEKKT